MTATTDNRELRALVQKWRDEVQGSGDHYDACLLDCADELEALLTRTEAGESAPVADGIYAWVRESPRHWERVTESDLSQPADPQKMRADGWFPVYTHPQDASAVAELLAADQEYDAAAADYYNGTIEFSEGMATRYANAIRRRNSALAALQQKESGRE